MADRWMKENPRRETDLDELEKMLEKVTPENTAPEVDFGTPVGKEVL